MSATRRLFLAWLGLLVLLAVEVVASRLLRWSNITPFLGLTMAGLVAWFFMDVGEGPVLIRVFAYAAVFWLVVILGLGSMDALTRVDHPVAARTPVSP